MVLYDWPIRSERLLMVRWSYLYFSLKMYLHIFCCFFLVFMSQVFAIQVQIENLCSYEELWSAITGISLITNKIIPLDTLPKLLYGQSFHFTIAPPWAERVWARADCSENGTQCQIGDCGFSDCNQAHASSQNTTLAEMTVHNNNMSYDISLGKGVFTWCTLMMLTKCSLSVDEHTHSVKITFSVLAQSSSQAQLGKCYLRSCNAPGWIGVNQKDHTIMCPAPNTWFRHSKQITSSCIADLHQIAGCKSDCAVYNTPSACCHDNYSSPLVCQPTNFIFKEACPEAYSYAFDDSSVVNCALNTSESQMKITFCPEWKQLYLNATFELKI